MNMLKTEENAKYRQTIKNVLDFEPEILKRFVNFMNNPDEETAVAQFGSDDKYFGVATLLCTMPGLPMFGHGQVEGLSEKYGMEYRRPKWDETPNQGLVERHEREIFPLMKKRYLFSGVTDFALYDFVAEGGGVDEDVYAYSNGVPGEHALVLYNNKFKTTRGRISQRVPTTREDGSTGPTTIARALGLSRELGEWMVFRDAGKGLEYLRPMDEIEGGFFWELSAFKYHVLTEFRGVSSSAERPYAELAASLAGRGVPSIEQALVELRFRPLHEPLREALGQGHLAYLAEGWDKAEQAPTKQAVVALEERVGHISDGLAYMQGGAEGVSNEDDRVKRTAGLEPILKTLRERFAAILAGVHAEGPLAIHQRTMTKAPPVGDPNGADERAEARSALEGETRRLLAWAELEAAASLLSKDESARSTVVDDWALGLPVARAFGDLGEEDAKEQAALVLLGAALPHLPLREVMGRSLEDPRARELLHVHEADGVSWLRKESFEDLARFLARRGVVLGQASAAMANRQVEDVLRLASQEGYRTNAIAAALAEGIPMTVQKKPSGIPSRSEP